MDVKHFVAQSLEGLKTQTQAHSATWHLGEEDQWFVDQDQGLVRFTFSEGVLAEAPVQIVGTFNPEDKTFLLAWDHPSVGEGCGNTRCLFMNLAWNTRFPSTRPAM